MRLTTQPVPQQIGEQLSWVWKALLGISTASGLVKPVCSFFPRDLLPTGDGWPSGLLSKTPVRNMTKDEKDALYQRAKNHLPALRTHLSSADGTLIRLLARSAFLLNPMDGFDGMPLDSALRLDPLEDPIPTEAGDRGTYVSASSKPRCSATFTSSTRPATKFWPGVNRWTTCTILMTCNALLRTCCWPDAPTSAAIAIHLR